MQQTVKENFQKRFHFINKTQENKRSSDARKTAHL